MVTMSYYQEVLGSRGNYKIRIDQVTTSVFMLACSLYVFVYVKVAS